MSNPVWVLITILALITGLLWGYRWGKGVGITLARIEADNLLQRFMKDYHAK